jgi:bla regulator protein blaR1
VETLLHAGLNNAVSAAFLALLVACLGRALARRPAILHCLWLLVLLKLVTPPLYKIAIPLPESLSSSRGASAEAEPGTIAAHVQILRLDLEDLDEPAVWTERDADVLELDAAAARPDAVEIARAAIGGAYEWLALHWVPIAGSIWLAGTLTTVVISMRRIFRFQLVLREATPGSDGIQSRVDELAARLGVGRPPQVWWIGGKLSPMLWALGACPRLIIPIELWKSLDERQRGTLLVHELAHLRRGDHHVRIFELVVTALYWWNPVLWWARQALRDVEEQCCDAWVVWAFPEAAKSYAETLLETLDFLNQSELSEPLLASGFGKVHHLRRRLTMIMSGTTPRLLGLRGGLAALSLGALLLPVNASWGQKPEEKQEIRVIVKTEDGEGKVLTPGVVDMTSTYVIDDANVQLVPRAPVGHVGDSWFVDGMTDRIQVFAPDGKPLTGMIADRGGNKFIVFDDKGANAGKPGEKSQVSVVYTADGSSVTISADSVAEALKKIAQHIARKESTPGGDKEKAEHDALLQVAKQLEEIAKAQQKGKGASVGVGVGAGKGKGTSTSRIVVHGLENVKFSNASPEKKAEIDGLRNEVKKLSAALAEAQQKLAQLEGQNVELRVFRLPQNVQSSSERQTTIVGVPEKSEGGEKGVSPLRATKGLTIHRIEPNVLSGGLAAGQKSKADEDRIQALEKKLNEVIETLHSLKKSKGD